MSISETVSKIEKIQKEILNNSNKIASALINGKSIEIKITSDGELKIHECDKRKLRG